MFINNFIAAEKEEIYLAELEEKLGCTTDDDKEVPDWMVSTLPLQSKTALELLERCADEFCQRVVVGPTHYCIHCGQYLLHHGCTFPE